MNSAFPNFSGCGIAVVTPFISGGEIDFNALERIIQYQIKQGADYLVVLGTTGESATLSKDEKQAVFRFFAQCVAGRIPLVAGMGGNDTRRLCAEIDSFDVPGFSAILSVTPYYNKPSQRGLLAHYAEVSSVSRWPVILYNVPGRTAVNMLPETIAELAAKHENIVAVKEACGNVEQIARVKLLCPDHFSVISGDDNLTLSLVALGAVGVISVTGNAFPGVISNMIRLASNGAMAEARKLHQALFSFTNLLFEEGSPAGIKAALKALNLCEEDVRLPLVGVSDQHRTKIHDAVRHLQHAYGT